MSHTAHKGISREQEFTALEAKTRVNREEHASRTPEEIAKAKDRYERRAARKNEERVLEKAFAAAVAGNPEKVTIAGMHLSQKCTETRLSCSEKAWLERISNQTNTNIFRKDEHSVAIRGLPANLAMAKGKIEEELARLSRKWPALTQ